MRARPTLVSLFTLGLVACTGPSASRDEAPAVAPVSVTPVSVTPVSVTPVSVTPVSVGRQALAESTYRYVRAALAGDTIVVTPLNGATVPCGADPAAATCSVARINLFPAEIGRDEANELLRRLAAASRDEAFTLVLVGSIDPIGDVEAAAAEASQRLLNVREVWVSAAPVPASSTVFHATRATVPCYGREGCTAVDTIRVNDWAPLRSQSLALRGAPSGVVGFTSAELPRCTFREQAPSYAWSVPDLALATRTGLLLAGDRTTSAVTGTGYFVKYMPAVACDHRHGASAVECCGLSESCLGLVTTESDPFDGEGDLPLPKKKPPVDPDCKDDHILGGIEFEYERPQALTAWLTSTGQPTSPAAHEHPARPSNVP